MDTCHRVRTTSAFRLSRVYFAIRRTTMCFRLVCFFPCCFGGFQASSHFRDHFRTVMKFREYLQKEAAQAHHLKEIALNWTIDGFNVTVVKEFANIRSDGDTSLLDSNMLEVLEYGKRLRTYVWTFTLSDLTIVGLLVDFHHLAEKRQRLWLILVFIISQNTAKKLSDYRNLKSRSSKCQSCCDISKHGWIGRHTSYVLRN